MPLRGTTDDEHPAVPRYLPLARTAVPRWLPLARAQGEGAGG